MNAALLLRSWMIVARIQPEHLLNCGNERQELKKPPNEWMA